MTLGLNTSRAVLVTLRGERKGQQGDEGSNCASLHSCRSYGGNYRSATGIAHNR